MESPLNFLRELHMKFKKRTEPTQLTTQYVVQIEEKPRGMSWKIEKDSNKAKVIRTGHKNVIVHMEISPSLLSVLEKNEVKLSVLMSGSVKYLVKGKSKLEYLKKSTKIPSTSSSEFISTTSSPRFFKMHFYWDVRIGNAKFDREKDLSVVLLVSPYEDCVRRNNLILPGKSLSRPAFKPVQPHQGIKVRLIGDSNEFENLVLSNEAHPEKVYVFRSVGISKSVREYVKRGKFKLDSLIETCFNDNRVTVIKNSSSSVQLRVVLIVDYEVIVPRTFTLNFFSVLKKRRKSQNKIILLNEKYEYSFVKNEKSSLRGVKIRVWNDKYSFDTIFVEVRPLLERIFSVLCLDINSIVDDLIQNGKFEWEFTPNFKKLGEWTSRKLQNLPSKVFLGKEFFRNCPPHFVHLKINFLWKSFLLNPKYKLVENFSMTFALSESFYVNAVKNYNLSFPKKMIFPKFFKKSKKSLEKMIKTLYRMKISCKKPNKLKDLRVTLFQIEKPEKIYWFYWCVVQKDVIEYIEDSDLPWHSLIKDCISQDQFIVTEMNSSQLKIKFDMLMGTRNFEPMTLTMHFKRFPNLKYMFQKCPLDIFLNVLLFFKVGNLPRFMVISKLFRKICLVDDLWFFLIKRDFDFGEKNHEVEEILRRRKRKKGVPFMRNNYFFMKYDFMHSFVSSRFPSNSIKKGLFCIKWKVRIPYLKSRYIHPGLKPLYLGIYIDEKYVGLRMGKKEENFFEFPFVEENRVVWNRVKESNIGILKIVKENMNNFMFTILTDFVEGDGFFNVKMKVNDVGVCSFKVNRNHGLWMIKGIPTYFWRNYSCGSFGGKEKNSCERIGATPKNPFFDRVSDLFRIKVRNCTFSMCCLCGFLSYFQRSCCGICCGIWKEECSKEKKGIIETKTD